MRTTAQEPLPEGRSRPTWLIWPAVTLRVC